MQSSPESSTYKDKGKTRDWVKPELNDGGLTIRRMAGRKGGRRRVKKGFAKTLTSEKAREYVKRRWEKRNTDENPSFE